MFIVGFIYLYIYTFDNGKFMHNTQHECYCIHYNNFKQLNGIKENKLNISSDHL